MTCMTRSKRCKPGQHVDDREDKCGNTCRYTAGLSRDRAPRRVDELVTKSFSWVQPRAFPTSPYYTTFAESLSFFAFAVPREGVLFLSGVV
jgi:hypothetical protein